MSKQEYGFMNKQPGDFEEDPKDIEVDKLISGDLREVQSDVEVNYADSDIFAFGTVYDQFFKEFQGDLVKQFALIKQHYIDLNDKQFDDEDNRIRDEITQRNQIIENWDKIHVEKATRVELLYNRLENSLRRKHNKILIFNIFYEWKNQAQTTDQKKKMKTYCKNVGYRKLLRKAFSAWRTDAHNQIKTKITVEFENLVVAAKRGKLGLLDNKIGMLEEEIEEAKATLREGVRSKEELTRQYEIALQRGVGGLNRETQIIAENTLIGGNY